MSDSADAKSSSAAPANRIYVYLRVRPRNSKDGYNDGATDILEIQPDRKGLIVDGNSSKPYSFDNIWNGKDVDQAEVFAQVSQPVIDNVFEGYWGTNIVYGQTGSGKSFSMSGAENDPDPKLEGIIPRTMKYIFSRVQAEANERTYTISLSYLHVYLDKLEDLCNPEGGEIKVTRDKDGVSFPGLVEHVVTSVDEMRERYEEANEHRVIRATKINDVSSRGHAALLIHIKSVPAKDPAGEVRSGKLFLIDLAGYERIAKTGIEEGIGMQEARTINGSLHSLGSCVQALSEKADYVPWRNAKLTRMLEDAVGGKAKCSMLLTSSPSSEHLFETVSTLQFGAKAMSIKTHAAIRARVDYKALSAKLQSDLDEAKTTIASLERRQVMPVAGGNDEGVSEPASANNRATSSMVARLQRDLATAQTEGEKVKSQNRRLATQLAELRVETEFSEGGASVVRPPSPSSSADGEAESVVASLRSTPTPPVAVFSKDMKKEVQRRVTAIKEMLVETYELKLAEVTEPLKEEAAKYRVLYENLKFAADDHLSTTKDVLSASYEEEIQSLKANSLVVQEKLKKNHATIKRSYQIQMENLSNENEELRTRLMQLEEKKDATATAAAALTAPPSPTPESRVGAPSLAETLIKKKQAERKVAELEALLAEARCETNVLQACVTAPAHLQPAISPLLGEYLPYLLSCHGDGAGKAYKLSGVSRKMFHKLQLKLRPVTANRPQWSDASFLVLDQIHVNKAEAMQLPAMSPIGSRPLAETIQQKCGTLPVRGLIRQEEENLYVALTSRPTGGESSALVVKVAESLLSVIHGEILSILDTLAAEEAETAGQDRLRITTAQQFTFRGWEAKRSTLDRGIEALLGRFNVGDHIVADQKKMQTTAPSGHEIDQALTKLPSHLFV